MGYIVNVDRPGLVMSKVLIFLYAICCVIVWWEVWIVVISNSIFEIGPIFGTDIGVDVSSSILGHDVHTCGFRRRSHEFQEVEWRVKL